jgi:hypothetical protein
MSLEQAQEFLVSFYEQMMLRENRYKRLLLHEWGLAPNGEMSLPINPEGL